MFGSKDKELRDVLLSTGYIGPKNRFDIGCLVYVPDTKRGLIPKLQDEVEAQQKEIDKLKAIVAELVDYVYRDQNEASR